MALNYSIHPESGRGNGPTHTLPCPILSLVGGERLAHGTLSGAINGPCEMYLVADEDCWLDADQNQVNIDPATSTLKIRANTPMWFSILPGVWKIKTLAA